MTVTEAPPDRVDTATVASRLRDRARRSPQGVALRDKQLGIWREITFEQYWESALTVAHGLLALGIEAGDRVAVHSENRPEWVVTDVASVAVRAASMGLYPTNPAPEVQYLLADSGARVLIAEDQEQVDKALSVKGDLPDLEHIIYIELRGIRHLYDDPMLMSWPDFLELGRRHRETHPPRRCRAHGGGGARRSGNARLYVGDDRPAEGGDAVGGERRVCERDRQWRIWLR